MAGKRMYATREEKLAADRERWKRYRRIHKDRRSRQYRYAVDRKAVLAAVSAGLPVAACRGCGSEFAPSRRDQSLCGVCRLSYRKCDGECGEYIVGSRKLMCETCQAAAELAAKILLSFGESRPQDRNEIERRVALYAERAAKKLPLFTGMGREAA